MDNKVSLYVVAKKEAVLIFIFMFLVAATSFIFGIKVGKEHAYRESDIINQDRKKVQMLSSEKGNGADDRQDTRKRIKDDINSIHIRLEEEIKKQMVEMETAAPESFAEEPVEVNSVPSTEGMAVETPPSDSFGAKKYTIQLGSYRSRKDAETFAQGFIVRGYQAMIRKVDIPDKGTWFRVSLGMFDTPEQAEAYIKQEESLFQGEDYIIRILL